MIDQTRGHVVDQTPIPLYRFLPMDVLKENVDMMIYLLFSKVKGIFFVFIYVIWPFPVALMRVHECNHVTESNSLCVQQNFDVYHQH